MASHAINTHTHTHTLHDRCTVRLTHELAIRTRVQSIVLRRGSNKGKVQKGKKKTLPDRYCSQNYMF